MLGLVGGLILIGWWIIIAMLTLTLGSLRLNLGKFERATQLCLNRGEDAFSTNTSTSIQDGVPIVDSIDGDFNPFFDDYVGERI